MTVEVHQDEKKLQRRLKQCNLDDEITHCANLLASLNGGKTLEEYREIAKQGIETGELYWKPYVGWVRSDNGQPQPLNPSFQYPPKLEHDDSKPPTYPEITQITAAPSLPETRLKQIALIEDDMD